mmetsp:Transcript_29336/g.74747  ORF Transcript_29336/g.74747 Transcript_29336/m.74747 type:complete len:160 (+) Transcript_29336:710-1189(+)
MQASPQPPHLSPMQASPKHAADERNHSTTAGTAARMNTNNVTIQSLPASANQPTARLPETQQPQMNCWHGVRAVHDHCILKISSHPSRCDMCRLRVHHHTRAAARLLQVPASVIAEHQPPDRCALHAPGQLHGTAAAPASAPVLLQHSVYYSSTNCTAV